MAKAPARAVDFDGAGNVWFKIFEMTAHADPTGTDYPTFPANSKSLRQCDESIVIGLLFSAAQCHIHHSKECSEWTVCFSVTIRLCKWLKSQIRYLLRVEHIALHDAYYYGGAQFYIACAQLEVTNGGDGSPGPLVAIPGVYTGYVCTDIFLSLSASEEFIIRK